MDRKRRKFSTEYSEKSKYLEKIVKKDYMFVWKVRYNFEKKYPWKLVRSMPYIMKRKITD